MKIDYEKIRQECRKSIERIQERKNFIIALSLIKDKTMRLQVELDSQKIIDLEEAKIKGFGFKDFGQCKKVEDYYAYLEYSLGLLSDHWMFSNNAYPDIESGQSFNKTITCYKMVECLKGNSPFDSSKMYHDSISDKMWIVIKNHFHKNAKPFILKTVNYLNSIIQIDMDYVDYFK